MPYSFTRQASAEIILANDANELQVAIETLSAGVWNVKEYGATGNGTTDDTASIQSAIDAAHNSSIRGGIVYFPGGVYKITSTLLCTERIRIHGSDGGGGNPLRWPEIIWFGAATGAAIQWTSGRYWVGIENICLHTGSGATNRLQHGVQFDTRIDTGAGFRNMQVANLTGNCFRFLLGGINVHVDHFRADNFNDYVFYWNHRDQDNLSISFFTVDNNVVGVGGVTGGGLFRSDVGVISIDDTLRLEINHGNFEMNSTLAAGEAAIKIGTNDAVAKESTMVKISNSWFHGGGHTATTGLKLEPASDFCRVILEHTDLYVSGIPWYDGSRKAIAAPYHSLTVIYPHMPTMNISPGAAAGATEIFGELNVVGILDQYGKRASPFINATTVAANWADPMPVRKGTVLMDVDALTTSSTSATCSLALGDGTMGTLTGVTGSGAAAQNVVTLNTWPTDLKIGSYVVIGGENKTVTGTNPTALQITLSSNLTTIKTDAAVTYNPPTFKTFSLALT